MKNKKAWLIGGALLVVFGIGFLLVSVIGLGIYSFETGTQIPVVYDGARRVYAFFGHPKAVALEAQEQMAENLATGLIPVLEDNELLSKDFQEEDFTSKILQELGENQETVDSSRFEITIRVETEGGEPDAFSPQDMLITVKGAADAHDPEDPRFDGEMVVEVEMEGMQIAAQADMRLIGDQIFIRLTEVPALVPELSEVKDRWILLDMEEYLTDSTGASSYFSPSFDVEKEEDEEITAEDMDHFVEFITDPRIIQEVEKLPDENIEGNDNHCARILWDREGLEQVAEVYEEVYDEPLDISDNEELESVKIEVCLSKETQRIHRLALIVEGEMESDTHYDTSSPETMILTLEVKVWDHNEVFDIQMPTEYEMLEDVMEEVVGGSLYEEPYDMPEGNYDEEYYYDSPLPGFQDEYQLQ